MAGRGPRVVGALVVVAVVALAAAYAMGLGWRLGVDQEPTATRTTPVPTLGATRSAPVLELPAPSRPLPVADPLTTVELRPAAVRRAVARHARDPRLGPRLGLAVAPLGGAPVYAAGPPVIVPASTLKLVTVLAALATLGPEHRFTTRVVRHGDLVTLVGGGDPLLAGAPDDPQDGVDYPQRADVATLAAQTAGVLAASGQGRIRLAYDTSLFSGPAVSPHWEADYLPDDVVSRVSALWVDEGRVAPDDAERAPDPARAAAARFARALEARGVRVVGRPVAAAAGAGAVELAAVAGSELVEVAQHVLETSDNEASEVLARHVALAEGEPGSFEGVARAVPAVLERLGVDMTGSVVRDGSGLSRGDRLSVSALIRLLAIAADPQRPELAGLLSGLPVAGWSGSLGYRFTERADAGLGRVRAKTGTLTGVHGLAGVVTGADGALMAFVAVADRVAIEDTWFARNRLDRLGAALAACRCAR